MPHIFFEKLENRRSTQALYGGFSPYSVAEYAVQLPSNSVQAIYSAPVALYAAPVTYYGINYPDPSYPSFDPGSFFPWNSGWGGGWNPTGPYQPYSPWGGPFNSYMPWGGPFNSWNNPFNSYPGSPWGNGFSNFWGGIGNLFSPFTNFFGGYSGWQPSPYPGDVRLLYGVSPISPFPDYTGPGNFFPGDVRALYGIAQPVYGISPTDYSTFSPPSW
jgi:hypothetical protein